MNTKRRGCLNQLDRCVVCDKEVKGFAGYIPYKGVCCLECFNKYMMEDAGNKSPLPKHPPAGIS